MQLSKKRANKEIGSSLEAEIEIKTSSKNIKLLEGLDLSEYFITSVAKATETSNDKGENEIIVKRAEGNKCPRCWKIVVNKCLRCEKVLSGN